MKNYSDSEVYDAEYSFDYDMNFWKKYCQKSGNSVLELGCGTGRLGIPLSETGFDYVGLDNSIEFIKSAKIKAQNLKKSPKFYIKNMCNFKLNQKFHTIIMPFNAFFHLMTDKELKACLNTVKKHMFHSSYFIVDVLNFDMSFFCRDKNEIGFIRGNDDRPIVFKTKSGKLFKKSQAITYSKKAQTFEVFWYHNFIKPKRKYNVSFKFRYYFPQELRMILENNGFEIKKEYGFFDSSSFKSDSPNQILILKKS
ncbi:MAG: class I SAM-dependent methyltransferase [Pseudomonadota bacterium]